MRTYNNYLYMNGILQFFGPNQQIIHLLEYINIHCCNNMDNRLMFPIDQLLDCLSMFFSFFQRRDDEQEDTNESDLHFDHEYYLITNRSKDDSHISHL